VRQIVAVLDCWTSDIPPAPSHEAGAGRPRNLGDASTRPLLLSVEIRTNVTLVSHMGDERVTLSHLRRANPGAALPWLIVVSNKGRPARSD